MLIALVVLIWLAMVIQAWAQSELDDWADESLGRHEVMVRSRVDWDE